MSARVIERQDAAAVGATSHPPVRPRRTRPRGTLLSALDIGTTKTCCLIARVEDDGPRILGIGHQRARGVKSGTIVDLEAAGSAIVRAVEAAEEMAGETIGEVIANLSGGFFASRLVQAGISLAGREVTDLDIWRVLEDGYRLRGPDDREVVHSVPVGFSLDDNRGIRDPRGMFGERLDVNMHLVSASAAAVRNLTAAIGHAHLELETLVVSPYAAGLSALVEDEIALGATVIDMGGGTTSVGVFFDGNLIFADTIPVGGIHVTTDIARGLSTPVAHAERLKALFGSAVAATTDGQEMIAVPAIGEEEQGPANHLPKSLLVGIIAPRIEETFELVRDSLEANGFEKFASRRLVLTGGASQLQGVREMAALILDKQVRIGRPLHVEGLAEATGGPAFSAAAGLLRFALSERAEPARAYRRASLGVFGRVKEWLRDTF